MPRPLSQRPPTSSLTRLLDTSAADGAVRPPIQAAAPSGEPRPGVAPPPSQLLRHHAAVPLPLIKRECILTQPTDEALTRLTELVRRTTGARVSASHTVRCLLLILNPVWPRLEEELRALGPMRLPGNARGNELARDALERTLSAAMARAIRSGDSVR